MALQGYLCLVKAQSSAVAMTDEATTTSDNLTYQITDSGKRVIDLNTDLIVKDGGSETTEAYAVNYLTGEIVFDTSGTRSITVTGGYVVLSTIATANSFNFSGTADVQDITNFQQSTRTYQAGLRSGTASLGRFALMDSFFLDALLSGTLLVVEYYVNATNKISFYGVLTSDSIEAMVENPIMESVDMQVSTEIGAF